MRTHPTRAISGPFAMLSGGIALKGSNCRCLRNPSCYLVFSRLPLAATTASAQVGHLYYKSYGPFTVNRDFLGKKL